MLVLHVHERLLEFVVDFEALERRQVLVGLVLVEELQYFFKRASMCRVQLPREHFQRLRHLRIIHQLCTLHHTIVHHVLQLYAKEQVLPLLIVCLVKVRGANTETHSKRHFFQLDTQRGVQCAKLVLCHASNERLLCKDFFLVCHKREKDMHSNLCVEVLHALNDA